MNLGSIPGYYYDQEKKKYFKITANHGLETGQKYTKSNVRYEKQVAKKRKVEQRDQQKRQAQTIKRSRLLSIPEYAGVGVHRETGVRSLTVDRAHADEAFVSQLRYENVYTAHSTVLSAHPLPSTSHTLLTQVGGQDSSYIFSTDGDISHSLRARWPKALDDSRLVHHTAFPGLAMSTSVWPAHDPQKLLACTSGGAENVFIGSLAHEDRISRPDIKLSIGNDETTLWDSAISSTGETAAIAGSDRIIHLSMEGRILSRLPKATHSRSVSWLNSSTIAASSSKALLLWDIRARGSSSRFSCRSAITGVKTVPSSGGNQLLLSTNQNLALQDTRMLRPGSTPVLDFNVLHEGPQLIFDVNDRDLVALSHKEGRKDEIRLLSLRTGRELRTLQVPGPVNQKRPTQLVWREDERGVEFLQACMGNTIGRWCWNSEDT